MSGRFLAGLSAVIALAWVAPLSAGQGLPQTPWGDPDLQGVWTGSTLTPLERPQDLAGREFLTDEEAAALEQRADQDRFVERVPRTAIRVPTTRSGSTPARESFPTGAPRWLSTHPTDVFRIHRRCESVSVSK